LPKSGTNWRPALIDPLRTVDANILLRYVLRDVPDQSEAARRLIESEQDLGVTAVALAEVAWVLAGSQYRRERSAIVEHLVRLLSRQNLFPLGFAKAEAQAALLACAPENGAADFGDALIAACARSAGAYEIYSFDRRFVRAGLTPIRPPLARPF
jgi:predicted nucleic acid-binding protein